MTGVEPAGDWDVARSASSSTCDGSQAHELQQEFEHIRIGALEFARLDRHELISHMFRSVGHGIGGWLLTANIDYLRQCAVDLDLRRLYSRADIVGADGIPVLWASRLLGRPLPDRLAGSDLIWLIAKRAAREGRRLFLLGGEPGAAEATCRALLERWPRLQIAGSFSPAVSRTPTAGEFARIRESLERKKPDVVLVALGAPKEGRLIAALKDEMPTVWWIGVGVSFSFVSGKTPRAPSWMQRLGLEWLHRLAHEPGRLCRRYLLNDLPFAVGLLARAGFARRWAATPGGRRLPAPVSERGTR